MLRATRAALPRRVRLDEGGQTYQVRPPSVRDALEIILFFSEADGLESDNELIHDVLDRLFPDELRKEILACPPGIQADFLRDFVFDGIPTVTATKRKVVEAATPAAWDRLFLQYCDFFHADVWKAYNDVPFGFFAVAIADHVPVLAARRNLRDSQVASVPHMEKKGRARWLGEQQRQIRRSEPKVDDTPLTEEELNAERDKLAAALSQYN